jgi:hypothetical protein
MQNSFATHLTSQVIRRITYGMDDTNTQALIRSLWTNAKLRARDAGLPFDMTVADIFVPTLCPVLGTPLQIKTGSSGPGAHSPTLDRMDPAKGYVRGNVMVISARANRLKSNATAAEMRKVLSYLEMCEQIGAELDRRPRHVREVSKVAGPRRVKYRRGSAWGPYYY